MAAIPTSGPWLVGHWWASEHHSVGCKGSGTAKWLNYYYYCNTKLFFISKRV